MSSNTTTSALAALPRLHREETPIITSRTSLAIRGPREFYGGLVLVALAAVAFWGASDLTGMDGGSFGPATAPRLYAGTLAILGLALCVTGLSVPAPRLESFGWRGLLAIVASIVCFATVVRPLGLVVASFTTFLIGCWGSRETRLLESLVAAAVLTVFCTVLFVYLLKLPFRLWPVF